MYMTVCMSVCIGVCALFDFYQASNFLNYLYYMNNLQIFHCISNIFLVAFKYCNLLLFYLSLKLNYT